MAMMIKFEYIFLIFLAIGFYYYIQKDSREKREKEIYIKNNLKVNSKILTKSGIIGRVLEIDGATCLIWSGKDMDKFSYIEISIASIDKIIEA
jgi:preprotein translocase YajC subunit